MPAYRLLTLALGLSLASALPATAQTAGQASDQAGSYLAARQADADRDFASAVYWYDKVLLVDPTNPALLERAITNDLALGDLNKAAKFGALLLKSGTRNQIAYLAVLTADIQAEDYKKVIADQNAGNTVGALLDHLILAWAEVGAGNMTQSQSDFDAVIKTPGTKTFGLYHKALALASTGDFEGADKLLASPDAQPALQLRRAVVARAQILSQLERDPDAMALIDNAFGKRLDAGMAVLRERLAKGETVDFDVARTARDGLAEVFFSLATALGDQADQTFVLLYARAATELRPDHVEAQLMTATILESLGQSDLAARAFSAVPKDDAAYVAAQIGAAEVTLRSGKVDDAVKLLQSLNAQRPADIGVLTALADAQHRQNQCGLAVASYDAAIALLPNPDPGNWPLFYKRAGCEAEIGQWPKAEADFRFALKLDPNQPRVLNQLGYSYVDRGEHLDEALKMIQTAVAAAPDQGYIIDSLAWAYYRMGRLQDAVAPQEKASKLMPVDPVVTDHLGDVYWSVGRKREAQFQWRRALSFGPDGKDKDRIQRKLDLGLDKVLEEEKAITPTAAPAVPNGN